MLRIVFMGTPDFAVPTLSELFGAGHEVVAVYTQPPRPAGRGMAQTRSPVHQFAESAGIGGRTPRTLRDPDTLAAFAALRADVAVVVAYGLILPRAALDAPVHGCLNLHGSRLPRWRGAAPIQRAIMAGDADTAVMVMRMEEGLDTGPICLAETIAIGADMTAGAPHDTMKEVGAGLMVRALAALERGGLVATPQPADGITYAAKIEKSESRIDFARPAKVVHDHIRGLSPFPGAWFEIEINSKPERIKVLRSTMARAEGAAGEPGRILDDALQVACAEGSIRLVELQRAGKKPMSAGELLRGFPLLPATRLR